MLRKLLKRRRRDEGKPQPLGVDGVVVIGLAGQQAIRPLCQRVLKEAAARAADDGQPLHGLSGVGEFHLHRRAVEGLVAAGGKRLLRLFCQLRHRDGVDAAHPTAALGEGLHLPHPEEPGQHLIDAALGGIQIRVHTDGRDAVFHQLKGHVLPAQLLERGEDDRVVGHNELTALPGRFLHHLGGDVQRHQDPGRSAAAIHQQAGVVPSAFLHDTIEDARMTYNDVVKFLKEFKGGGFVLPEGVRQHLEDQVPEIVYALTNEKGRNRGERANDLYYQGIRQTKFASFIKICDRLANIQYTMMFVFANRMLDVYRREYPEFIRSISEGAVTQVPDAMKEEAERLLNSESYII